MKSESILSFSILHGNSRLEAATMSWLTSLGRMSEEKKRKLLQHATFHHCQCGSWGLVSTLCNSHTCHSRWQKNKNVPTQVVLSKHGSANAFTSFLTPYCENGGKRRNRQKKKKKEGRSHCVAGALCCRATMKQAISSSTLNTNCSLGDFLHFSSLRSRHSVPAEAAGLRLGSAVRGEDEWSVPRNLALWLAHTC